MHDCKITIASFDLWMSKGAHDIFSLVINFLEVDWQSTHVTLGLLEANETIGQALVKILIELLDVYGLIKKMAYILRMKDLIVTL